MHQNRQASMGIGAAVLTVASSGSEPSQPGNLSLNLLDWFFLNGLSS